MPTRYVDEYQTRRAADDRSRDLLEAHIGRAVLPGEVTRYLWNRLEAYDASQYAIEAIDMPAHGIVAVSILNRVLTQAEKNRIKTPDEFEETEFKTQDFRRLCILNEISVSRLREIRRLMANAGFRVLTFKDFASVNSDALAAILGETRGVIERWQARARLLDRPDIGRRQ